MKFSVNRKTILKTLFFIFIVAISTATGFYINRYVDKGQNGLLSPFVDEGENISYPLLAYSIPNLRSREFETSQIKIEELISKENNHDSYDFSYTTLGKRMTGQINIPDKITFSPLQKHPVIIMIRGYVPKEIYRTGMGTKSAAAVLAENGYITVAPDFFGYGESDPEPEDSWQTRFEKPIAIIELIRSLELNGIPDGLEEETNEQAAAKDTNKITNKNFRVDDIGIWAHSNGGQIALTTLEILDEEIPTTLWAPVTAPFPYSILYFGDELEDEGKAQRKWLSIFEEKYDVFEFSLTQHLNFLQGPIQIHHGDADDAALIYWSEEFVDKIELENERRAEILENISATTASESAATATQSASKNQIQNLEEIDLTFYRYPGANHNLTPSWDLAINRDLQFFDKYLEK